jgi:hypothetical protein|tara:strand:- start:3176 stop:3367 length:192 start_codon:yes stop_codon:yes gene_type:complete
MTKSSIVQRLLDEKKITAEEAVVLLKNEGINIPMYTPNPYFNDPNWTTTPPIWCEDNTTSNID